MGLQIPEELATMFLIVTGDSWPESDEDELWRISASLHQFAGELRSYTDSVTGAGSGALTAFRGPAADSLRVTLDQLARSGALAQIAAEVEGMAGDVYDIALQVQYTKIIIIGQLVILAAQILYLLAIAAATAGISTLGIPLIVQTG
ncbi:MAG TPA: hypothetical protein VD813_03745, partial [Pseudonocardia sp.]|nr:hypothetical protein [Pseudonocardia sp.]